MYSLRTLPHLGHDGPSSEAALTSALEEVGRTQAVAVDAGGNGVVVTATEFARPIVRTLVADKPPTPG